MCVVLPIENHNQISIKNNNTISRGILLVQHLAGHESLNKKPKPNVNGNGIWAYRHGDIAALVEL